MAKAKKESETTASASASAETPAQPPQGPVVALRAQYIKDLSFENPHSPVVLAKIKSAPHISVSVEVKAEGLGQDQYEVVLVLTARAVAEENTIYLAELAYAAIVTTKNVPAQNLEGVLFVYVPGLIFPFARRVMADVTREGGMPPLLLDPIDFGALYMKRKKAA